MSAAAMKSLSVIAETKRIGDGFSIPHTLVGRFGTVWVASLLSLLEPVKVAEASGALRSREGECVQMQEALIAFAQ